MASEIDYEPHDIRWFLQERSKSAMSGLASLPGAFAALTLAEDNVYIHAFGIVLLLGALGIWALPVLNWLNRDKDRLYTLIPLIEVVRKRSIAENPEGDSLETKVAVGKLCAYLLPLSINPAPLTHAGVSRLIALDTLHGTARYRALKTARSEMNSQAASLKG